MPTRRVGSTSFVDVDNGDGMNDSRLRDEEPTWDLKSDARPLLPKAAFFLGDLRDGLPMVRSVEPGDSRSTFSLATD